MVPPQTIANENDRLDQGTPPSACVFSCGTEFPRPGGGYAEGALPRPTRPAAEIPPCAGQRSDAGRARVKHVPQYATSPRETTRNSKDPRIGNLYVVNP